MPKTEAITEYEAPGGINAAFYVLMCVLAIFAVVCAILLISNSFRFAKAQYLYNRSRRVIV